MPDFKSVSLIIFIFVSLGNHASRSYAQSKIKTENERPGLFVEYGPIAEYPGGDSALSAFIKKNMRYPEDAIEKGIEGRVIVQFIISKTGKVKNVKVLRGVCMELDKEALRLVNMLPDFKPGKMKGFPVEVSYILPVNFKLPEIPEKK